jgi:hypothetical protein
MCNPWKRIFTLVPLAFLNAISPKGQNKKGSQGRMPNHKKIIKGSTKQLAFTIPRIVTHRIP